MKKIGAGVKELMAALGGTDDVARKAARAAEVNVVWRNAVEAVYGDAASLVLAHVNAVYILDADAVVAGSRDGSSRARPIPEAGNCRPPQSKKQQPAGGAQLVVYSDDSLIRSDIDARQEFLKMRLREQGEHVETFKILPSRFDMKARHPFVAKEDAGAAQSLRSAGGEAPSEPLTPQQREQLEQQALQVENPSVRSALLKAIDADMKRKSTRDAKKDV